MLRAVSKHSNTEYHSGRLLVGYTESSEHGKRENKLTASFLRLYQGRYTSVWWRSEVQSYEFRVLKVASFDHECSFEDIKHHESSYLESDSALRSSGFDLPATTYYARTLLSLSSTSGVYLRPACRFNIRSHILTTWLGLYTSLRTTRLVTCGDFLLTSLKLDDKQPPTIAAKPYLTRIAIIGSSSDYSQSLNPSSSRCTCEVSEKSLVMSIRGERLRPSPGRSLCARLKTDMYIDGQIFVIQSSFLV
ncbi:hypothetical protein M8818_006362 [Zalaria obscura]|uniref:Uncharacterized protein n=1 Tax=Zalaria obscura TaxID=2024903 RepID=A0ACC3S607_9PEZI